MLTVQFQDLLLKSIFVYSKDFERFILYLKPEYFSGIRETLIRYVRLFYIKYRKIPSLQEILSYFYSESELSNININTAKELIGYITQQIEPLENPAKEYVLNELVKFIQLGELQNAFSGLAQAIKQDNLKSFFEKIREIEGINITDSFSCFGQHLPSTLNGNIPQRFKLGIPHLDRFNLGLKRGELGMFIAPTGKGKSAFLVHLAVQYSLQKLPVLIISLEMDEDTWLERLASYVSGIPLILLPTKKEQVKCAIQEFAKSASPIYIKQFPPKTPIGTILSYITTFKQHTQPELGIVLVDFLQLLTTGRSEERLHTDLGLCTSYLRGLAVEQNLIIWVTSQTNRDAEASGQISLKTISESYESTHTADLILAMQEGHNEHAGAFILYGLKCRYAPFPEKYWVLSSGLHMGRIFDVENFE